MKRSKVVVDQRRANILAYLQENPDTKMADLAELFSVSLITIRRDLKEMEEDGLLRRAYGDIRLDIAQPESTDSYDAALIRQAIANYAVNMIEPGDTIFINSSQTAIRMLKQIKSKGVTVITNNMMALKEARHSNVQIIMTGGELNPCDGSLSGDFALNSLNIVTATKCFMGANGISSTGGITTAISQRVQVNAKMIERCVGPRVILANGSKIGCCRNFFTCPITDITTIITDNQADPEEIKRIEQKGVEVIVLDPRTGARTR